MHESDLTPDLHFDLEKIFSELCGELGQPDGVASFLMELGQLLASADLFPVV